MKRYTYELGHKGSGFYEPNKIDSMPINNYFICTNVLGKYEDLLEKYNIDGYEELEKILEKVLHDDKTR